LEKKTKRDGKGSGKKNIKKGNAGGAAKRVWENSRYFSIRGEGKKQGMRG